MPDWVLIRTVGHVVTGPTGRDESSAGRPLHLIDLGYLAQEETIEGCKVDDTMLNVSARFTITPRGREVLAEWFDV